MQVCDVGCSGGVQIFAMAKKYPNSTFLGIDVDPDVIDKNKIKAKEMGLQNINFEVQDGCNLPETWRNRFDLITVWDVVHDVPYSRKLLQGIYNILKPRGSFVMNDIKMHSDLSQNMHESFAPAFYGMSLFHCMPVSLYFEGGEGLGTCWGIELQQKYLEDAGFKNIKRLHVPDVQSYFLAEKEE